MHARDWRGITLERKGFEVCPTTSSGRRSKLEILLTDNKYRSRAEDLNMAAIFNSRERTVHEWKALFQEADPRFVLHKVIEPRGSALGILEVVWET